MKDRLTVILATTGAAVTVIGLAAPVSAGKGVAYNGKTEQGLDVAFRATTGKVSGFKTTVRALCISPASGKSVLEFYPVLLQSPVKRKGKGKRFTIVFTGPSSTNITVKGKFKGRKTTGSLDVRYTKTLGMTPAGFLIIGACSAQTTWTAKHK